ncbi:MAG TPA: cupin domain-containing protein [Dyella sp.]|uniref:cupin domain-containing protein n=1 Tax=Dyella sp. TaxID=1869338 RepID=UPI002F94D7B0
MSNARRVSLCLIPFAFAAAMSCAYAQDASPNVPQAKRTVLDRHDQSGVTGKEIVIGTAELPAGSVIGWHRHAGDESGYVLRGNLILKTQGQPDQVLKAGDHFFNARGAVHSLIAAPGTDGGTALSTWIVDKGKPLAEPVK